MSKEELNDLEQREGWAIPWKKVAEALGVKSRKTIAKLVDQGFLTRLPGIDRLLITRESFRAYMAGGRVPGAGV